MNLSASGTLVGRSVTIRGEVTGSEDLYVDGTIEGTITLVSGRLTIGPNARIIADVQAPEIIIMGALEGNVRSEGRVELRNKASVVGDIVAVRLAVEEGAIIRGLVDLRGPVPVIETIEAPVESPQAEPSPLFHN